MTPTSHPFTSKGLSALGLDTPEWEGRRGRLSAPALGSGPGANQDARFRVSVPGLKGSQPLLKFTKHHEGPVVEHKKRMNNKRS